MLEIKKISKKYVTGDFNQLALDNVSIKFRQNEFVSILGPSGSGKTTLLNILGGLDQYDNGDLIINNASTKKYKSKDWDAYRNNCVGFIFQNYNLINHISVLSNVEMCLTLSNVKKSIRRKKALEALDRVGLKDHADKKPNQLSGGQMQRVSIARALINNPDIILADEPTGALDSKTSVQIMELIREIAQDKLVIMVTHNPELADKYSSRIIELKDGKVVKDTNPIKEKEKDTNEYKLKYTKMRFMAALALSFNNIRTKKGRTILTSFASSIGIIGIALILSLSNGFDKQIDKFEKNVLSSMPIMVGSKAINMDAETMQKIHDSQFARDDYPSDKKIYLENTSQMNEMIHINKLTNDYLDYLNKADPETISGISYNRVTNINLINKINEEYKPINISSKMASIPFKLDENKNSFIDDKYDYLYGTEAKKKEELLLIVNSKNEVSKEILEALNFNVDDFEEIDFKDILNKTIKVAMNNDFYNKTGEFFTINQDYKSIYESDKTITLKIVGIIRLKEDLPSSIQMSALTYSNELLNYIISENKNSDIVKAQNNANYNLLTGEKFASEEELSTESMMSSQTVMTKNTMLSYLGADSVPNAVYVYPRDFKSKEELLKYLDKYNDGKNETDKIVYTDQAKMLSSLSDNIMNAITIVLITFSAISLVVSSIMIGIITYISVLERTKEIGILRSIGARKKDITRVFNAETFIVGLFSGILGIGITLLLLIPANHILYNITELENIAILSPLHAIILILVSLVLTLIGGSIPAKLASKKDPVEALRTE